MPLGRSLLTSASNASISSTVCVAFVPAGLEDERRNAGIAVDKAVISVGLLSQFDVGHVFQTQYLTVGSGSNHDLSELFGSHFTATILHGILERIVGVLAERTGCRFDVLFRQDGRNIRRDQFILAITSGFIQIRIE